jgi:hypothetical protein
MRYILINTENGSIVSLETPTNGIPYIPTFQTIEDAKGVKEWLEQDCGYPELRIAELKEVKHEVAR